MNSPLAQAFAQGPSWFPQQLDAAGDRVLLVHMSEANYREASFLDQRMLTPQSKPQWAAWDELAAADQDYRRDAQFIFHIGHVGSTLIARLLGELEGVFALREPQILRNFADQAAEQGKAEALWGPGEFDTRLATATAWLSRTFDTEARALIKATSFVSEIAAPLLGEDRKALFLTLSPERYILTILAGENSRQELAMLAPSRLARLHHRIGRDEWTLWDMPEHERAAMSWLCEMTALEKAAETSNVIWCDFDDFLVEPGDSLEEFARFFGFVCDQNRARALTQGPIMTQYSKAPDYDYSASDRENLLAKAADARKDDIAKALIWLKEAASRDALLNRTLARYSGDR
jgi:hypothetical protein